MTGGRGLDVLIGRRPLSTVTASWGDMVVTHRWPGGSWGVTLGLNLGRRDRGQWIADETLADVIWKGCPIWVGNVLNGISADGQLTLTGAIRESEPDPALDGSGLFTNVPDTAIDASIAAGSVHWTRPWSIGASAVGDGSPVSQTLGQLLDLNAAAQSKRMWVDEFRRARLDPDSVTPTWYLMPGAAELVWNRQDTPDVLVGAYFDAAGTPHTVSVGTGSRRQLADFSDRPQPLDDPTATGLLNTALAASQAGGWDNNIQVSIDQITSPGGIVPHPSMVRAGHVLRLLDHPDPRPGRSGLPYTDVMLAESSWATADGTMTLTPQGADASEQTKVYEQIGATTA